MSLLKWVERRIHTSIRLFRTDIWSTESLGDKGPRGRLHAFLRVVAVTLIGLDENRAASRAAALSFSSLIGLGPLVAIAVMIAGFMFNDNQPDLAVNYLDRLIRYVAPQIDQYESETAKARQQAAVAHATHASQSAANENLSPVAVDAPIEVRPELLEFINGFVSGTRNGALGADAAARAAAALTLILIVMQLFTSIETAFNEIWGVRRGRSWFMRIVLYWTVLSLGAVLFFAALTGLAAGTFSTIFREHLPFGAQLAELLSLFLPLGSAILLVGVLTVFYRAIPNTHVFWKPAAIGALLVSILLFANNYLAFLYISRVLLSRALYGSLAIPIVLMFGLYIFWFIVLLGGQVSYAVQNARFRNSRAAWNTLAESMRERLSLVVLLCVCRRFQSCEPPHSSSELGKLLGVPDQLLNECINRLVRMRLLTPIPANAGESSVDDRYHPARPLGRTTLAHFKIRDDDLGDDPTGPTLAHREPILALYNAATTKLTDSELFTTPLDRLLHENPLPPDPPAGPLAP